MIVLDYKDRRPIYEQIVERFQQLILHNVLKPEEQLPSVRNLAMELSINPNTIQRAYTELERLGIIYCVKGKGNYVALRDNLFLLKHAELEGSIKELIKKARELKIKEEDLTLLLQRIYKEVDSHD